MNQELFILPLTDQPDDITDLVTVSPPAIAPVLEEPQDEAMRHINWSRVWGFAAVLIVSAAIWTTIAVEVSRLWR